MVLPTCERLRIGACVDTATLRAVLDGLGGRNSTRRRIGRRSRPFPGRSRSWRYVAYRLEGDHEIHQSHRARRGEFGCEFAEMQISKRSEAVVGGRHDYVTPASQGPTVEHRIVAGSGGVPPPLIENRAAPLTDVFQARGPDVRHQAVFAPSAGLCRPLDRARVVIVSARPGLRRDAAPFESVASACHGAGLRGGMKRFLPEVSAPYGAPRNT